MLLVFVLWEDDKTTLHELRREPMTCKVTFLVILSNSAFRFGKSPLLSFIFPLKSGKTSPAQLSLLPLSGSRAVLLNRRC